MAFPDLADLPIQSVFALLVAFGAIDTVASALLSIQHKDFNGEYLTNFLVSHVAKVWFPIAALAIVGHGLAFANLPAIPASGLAATGGLVAYGVATLSSVVASMNSTTPTP